MLTDFSPNSPKFICKICDIKTNNKKDFNRHILTLKHGKMLNLTNCEQNNPQNTILQIYVCDICNKQYKSRVGLWSHKKICKHQPTLTEDNQIFAFSHEVSAKQGKSEQNFVPFFSRSNEKGDTSTLDMNMIMQLLKQNDEFKVLMVEQNNKLIEAYTNQGTKVQAHPSGGATVGRSPPRTPP